MVRRVDSSSVRRVVDLSGQSFVRLLGHRVDGLLDRRVDGSSFHRVIGSSVCKVDSSQSSFEHIIYVYKLDIQVFLGLLLRINVIRIGTNRCVFVFCL